MLKSILKKTLLLKIITKKKFFKYNTILNVVLNICKMQSLLKSINKTCIN